MGSFRLRVTYTETASFSSRTPFTERSLSLADRKIVRMLALQIEKEAEKEKSIDIITAVRYISLYSTRVSYRGFIPNRDLRGI